MVEMIALNPADYDRMLKFFTGEKYELKEVGGVGLHGVASIRLLVGPEVPYGSVFVRRGGQWYLIKQNPSESLEQVDVTKKKK